MVPARSDGCGGIAMDSMGWLFVVADERRAAEVLGLTWDDAPMPGCPSRRRAAWDQDADVWHVPPADPRDINARGEPAGATPSGCAPGVRGWLRTVAAALRRP